MFSTRYFNPRYWASRFWPKLGGVVASPGSVVGLLSKINISGNGATCIISAENTGTISAITQSGLLSTINDVENGITSSIDIIPNGTVSDIP